jgi:hypothetical protein
VLTPRTIGSALAALGLGIGALVPIFVVLYPAAGISPADAQNPAVVLPAIAANPALVVIPGAVQIAAHALGIVGMIGLWMTLGRSSSAILSIATVFGLVWLGVDVVLNAVTYHAVPALAAANASGSTSAAATFVTTTQLVDAARLGAHVAGGLWMLGVAASAATLGLPRFVAWLGIPIGVVFAANLFVPALMNVSFLTVPAWLVVLGVAVARGEPATAPSFALRSSAG